MDKSGLRKEYEQLLSDMLLMQYRAEVFRRKMQVACGRDDKFGKRMVLSLEDVVNDLVLMSGVDELAPEVKKQWWTR